MISVIYDAEEVTFDMVQDCLAYDRKMFVVSESVVRATDWIMPYVTVSQKQIAMIVITGDSYEKMNVHRPSVDDLIVWESDPKPFSARQEISRQINQWERERFANFPDA